MVQAEPSLNTVALAHDLSPLGMYLAADWVVKSVMILLLIASVMTWAVFVYKSVQLVVARRKEQTLFNVLVKAASISTAQQQLNAISGNEKSAAYSLLTAVQLEQQLSNNTTDADGLKERVNARLERVQLAFSAHMNRGLGVVATVGSVAPFIGLFGTVWGIMNSFFGIAESQTTNLAVVAPGIAEALLATAIGLVAAIPAVIIYNHFARALSGYRAQLGDVATALLILVSRDLSLKQASNNSFNRNESV